MKKLQEYCASVLRIDGLKTYILSSEHYERILHDQELFEQLDMSDVAQKTISRLIGHAKQICDIKIQLAFVQHESRKVCVWEPVNVCEYGNHFYHVFIADRWICRECGHDHFGKIIMPMFEADGVFLDTRNNRKPDIPAIFHKTPCKKCGKLLQNHLFISE